MEGLWLITISKRSLLCTLSYASVVVSKLGWLGFCVRVHCLEYFYVGAFWFLSICSQFTCHCIMAPNMF
nr:hypothetical protein CFP56_72760 [Quercus suber]